MKHIDPNEISTQEVSSLLTGCVHPRPIALVATLSENGNNNLAPFSFFNAFGANPPMIGFSPSRKVRDGKRKDTYYNLSRTKECTVQMVTYDMVEQVSLASTEYETGIDEFVKSGLTPIPSDLVGPPRVKESPVQMECRLEQVIPLGDGNGSGNLMICQVLKFHIDESVFDGKTVDPYKLDLVGRNGTNFYTRANGDALFQVKKPTLIRGIGYDQLPVHMRLSSVFTGSDLARFGNSEKIPDLEDARNLAIEIKQTFAHDSELDEIRTFLRAKHRKQYRYMLAIALKLKEDHHPHANHRMEEASQAALHSGDIDFAWLAALLSGQSTGIQ
jgi:flavin reductase (DIM6/NTAB) family NADH-FMN oxidoreductase RutF